MKKLKKMKQKVISILFVFMMVITGIHVPVYATEEEPVEVEETQKEIETIEETGIENQDLEEEPQEKENLLKQKDTFVVLPEEAINFNEEPIYKVGDEKLTLPEVEGYKVEIFGSSKEAVIALDGTVEQPLNDTTVVLLYKLIKNETNEIIECQKETSIMIPARNLDISGENKKPKVIPELREWKGGTGSITLNADTRIIVDGANYYPISHNKTDMLAVGSEINFYAQIQIFKEDLKDILGIDAPIIVDGIPSDNDIYFTSRDAESILGAEGYTIEIGGKEEEFITIKAPQKVGALYGGISILQILKTNDGKLPKGIIRDYPQTKRRGYMLDVGRTFLSIEYLNDTMRQMRWYKMNTFSLHLSDNDIWQPLTIGNSLYGGFRLESDVENLTSKDGYYTKAEFRELQYTGMDIGINIIPELDTPGHAVAYVRAWPELVFPGNEKYLDAGNPETATRVKALFDEYILPVDGEEVFVGPDVNIGTDEYKAGTGAEKEKFRFYVDTLLKHIRLQGKNPVFWGSLKENAGSTPVTTDALMFAWYKGYADAKESLDAGYEVLSMEDQEVYIVPGGGWYAKQFGNASSIYNSWLSNDNSGWNNKPASIAHPRVVGGQFAVWNDFIGNGISEYDISYRAINNMTAIAEKTWAATDKKDAGMSFDQFSNLIKQLGDAPNTEYLFTHASYKDNLVISLDEKVENIITGATFKDIHNVTVDANGRFEKGIRFHGKSSYIDTNLTSTGFDWTTAMWIKPDANNENDSILMEGKTGTLKLKQGNSNKLGYSVNEIFVDGNPQNRISKYNHTFDYEIPEGRWTHITLTGTSDGVSLYVNGKFIEELRGKPYPNYNCQSGANGISGSEYPNNGVCNTPRYYQTLMLPTTTIGSHEHAFAGIVDDFKVYDRVLSDKEIVAISKVIDSTAENYALHKETITTAANGDQVGANAVDGVYDIAKRWEFPDDPNRTPQSITIDLADRYDINRVKVVQRTWGNNVNRIENIKIEALDADNQVLATIYDGAYDSANIIENHLYKEFMLADAISARKIKVTITPLRAGANWMVNIQEIEVYGPNAREDMYTAYHKLVAISTSSSDYLKDDILEKIEKQLAVVEQAMIDDTLSTAQILTIITDLEEVLEIVEPIHTSRIELKKAIKRLEEMGSQYQDIVTESLYQTIQDTMQTGQIILENKEVSVSEVKEQTKKLTTLVEMLDYYVEAKSMLEAKYNMYEGFVTTDKLQNFANAIKVLSEVVENNKYDQFSVAKTNVENTLDIVEKDIKEKNLAKDAEMILADNVTVWPGFEVEKINDGSRLSANRFAPKSEKQSASNAVISFCMKFNKETTLNTILIFETVEVVSNEALTEHISNLKIEAKIDGAWKQIYFDENELIVGPYLDIQLKDRVTCTELRFTMTSNTAAAGLNINEIEVYNTTEVSNENTSGRGILKNLTLPKLTPQVTTLVFPEVDGYDVRIVSSSDELIIDKNGTVVIGEEEKDVVLTLQLVKQNRQKLDALTEQRFTMEYDIHVPSTSSTIPVDKEELRKAIQTANDKIAAGYTKDTTTASTWSVFSEKMSQAEIIFMNDNATQEQVNAMAKELSDVQLVLRASKDDITILQTLLDELKNRENNYTAEEFVEAKAIIINVEAILAKGELEITKDEAKDSILAINEKQEELNIMALVKILKITIQEAQDILDGNTSNIRPKKIQALQAAVDRANGLIKANSKDVIAMQNAIESILQAIKELDEIVDKTKLISLIERIFTLIEENYTKESWAELIEALENAKIVIADEDVDEDAVTLAYITLLDKLQALKTKSGAIISVPKTNNQIKSKALTGDSTKESIFLFLLIVSGSYLMIRKVKRKI